VPPVRLVDSNFIPQLLNVAADRGLIEILRYRQTVIDVWPSARILCEQRELREA